MIIYTSLTIHTPIEYTLFYWLEFTLIPPNLYGIYIIK